MSALREGTAQLVQPLHLSAQVDSGAGKEYPVQQYVTLVDSVPRTQSKGNNAQRGVSVQQDLKFHTDVQRADFVSRVPLQEDSVLKGGIVLKEQHSPPCALQVIIAQRDLESQKSVQLDDSVCLGQEIRKVICVQMDMPVERVPLFPPCVRPAHTAQQDPRFQLFAQLASGAVRVLLKLMSVQNATSARKEANFQAIALKGNIVLRDRSYL